MLVLDTEEQRRRAIAWAIALKAETSLAPDQCEIDLLEQYAQGGLTLQQVLDQLDSPVQHLLYRSQATHLLTAYELTQLVEQSQRWNEEHEITGLLCYTNKGHFVQLLEGPVQEVHALYRKIQQDKRHTQVTTLSDKASAARWFADWRMALVETEPHDFFWLVGYLEAKASNLVRPQIPIVDPLLANLLYFSNA